MKSVLLRLEGPLQSWGTQGRYGTRDTEREPSKSGVLGLVGAALGMPRDDQETLQSLRQLEMAVRVDREGTLMRDYHTVGGGTFRGREHGIGRADGKLGETAITQRFYLADASFLVALGGEDTALIARIAVALQDPHWPLSLGRRACPPSEPVYAGVVDDTPVNALHKAAFPSFCKDAERIRVISEADATSGSPRQDDPVRFTLYERHHATRYIQVSYIDLPKS